MKDKANFKVEEDVAAIRKAIEGIGKTIMFVIATFFSLFCKYLIFGVCIDVSVFSSLAGTTDKTLIEVLAKRSNAQRQLIAQAYEKATGRVSVKYCELRLHVVD